MSNSHVWESWIVVVSSIFRSTYYSFTKLLNPTHFELNETAAAANNNKSRIDVGANELNSTATIEFYSES